MLEHGWVHAKMREESFLALIRRLRFVATNGKKRKGI